MLQAANGKTCSRKTRTAFSENYTDLHKAVTKCPILTDKELPEGQEKKGIHHRP